jgi:hypothetical protein
MRDRRGRWGLACAEGGRRVHDAGPAEAVDDVARADAEDPVQDDPQRGQEEVRGRRWGEELRRGAAAAAFALHRPAGGRDLVVGGRRGLAERRTGARRNGEAVFAVAARLRLVPADVGEDTERSPAVVVAEHDVAASAGMRHRAERQGGGGMVVGGRSESRSGSAIGNYELAPTTSQSACWQRISLYFPNI